MVIQQYFSVVKVRPMLDQRRRSDVTPKLHKTFKQCLGDVGLMSQTMGQD